MVLDGGMWWHLRYWEWSVGVAIGNAIGCDIGSELAASTFQNQGVVPLGNTF